MTAKKVFVKPTPRSLMGFDMNHYHPDAGDNPDPEDAIRTYIPAAEDRDIGWDDLYSDMLDCVVEGLDMFAADPLWSDGVDGFESFDQLAEVNHHPKVGEYQPIYDRAKAEEAFKHIKAGVAKMVESFDFEG